MVDSSSTTAEIAEEANKVYVCGPMSGIPDFNRPAFNTATRLLRKQGYEVVNPAEFPPNGSWEGMMKHAIAQMLTCDRVSLLEGWSKSRGAKLEVLIAQEVGIKIETLLETSATRRRALRCSNEHRNIR